MAKECIEHVNDKKEGMKYNKGSYGASMHGPILTTLNVLSTLWACFSLVCIIKKAINFMKERYMYKRGP